MIKIKGKFVKLRHCEENVEHSTSQLHYNGITTSLVALAPRNDRKIGFTLAEVLITLGVIGVVAAMTMPVLMQNIKGAQFISKFKKELSVLNQAVTINKAKYDWDFSDAEDTHGAEHSGRNKVEEIFTKNLKVTKNDYRWNFTDKSSKVYDDEDGYKTYDIKLIIDYGVLSSDYNTYTLPDGAVVSYSEASFLNCTLPKDMSLNEWIKSGSFDFSCIGYIDVNGPQLPNTEVSCATGTTSKNLDEPCTVDNNSIGDVYPVVYYDSVVAPASNAAAAVLRK